MEFFDVFLTIGATNGAIRRCPRTEEQALRLMDSYWVAESLVFHTVARDSDPELGNAALSSVKSERLRKVWAADLSFVIEESPQDFLKRALSAGAKAILINPLTRNIRISRSPRLSALAKLLEERRIPLLATYRAHDKWEDTIDWYDLADFCNMFPELPVLAWEWRTRANRPLFDALAQTKNLRVSVSSLWQARMIACIVDAFGPDRIVFSMGLPGLDPGSFQMAVNFAEISREARLALANGTIRKILGQARYEQ